MNQRLKGAALIAVAVVAGTLVFALDGELRPFDLVFGLYAGALLLYVLIRTGFFAQRVRMTFAGESAPRILKMRKAPGGKRFSASTDARFITAEEAASLDSEVKPADRVIGLCHDGHAVAYPLSAMGLREVANEEFTTGDVSVTWWPVAYSARAYSSTEPGGTLELGPSVNTVLNSSVLYDPDTNGYAQFTGDCIIGPAVGSMLTQVPVLLTTWAAWVSAYPDSEVMSKDGTPEFDVFERYYANNRAGLYRERNRDRRLPDKEVVFGLRLNGESMAWPFTTLLEAPFLQQELGGEPILVVHERISSTAAAFRPFAEGRRLTFESASGNPPRPTSLDPEVEYVYEPWMLRDLETGSTWRAITGECVDGELEGEQLEMLPGQTGFWYAWCRFHPGTGIHAHELAREPVR